MLQPFLFQENIIFCCFYEVKIGGFWPVLIADCISVQWCCCCLLLLLLLYDCLCVVSVVILCGGENFSQYIAIFGKSYLSCVNAVQTPWIRLYKD